MNDTAGPPLRPEAGLIEGVAPTVPARKAGPFFERIDWLSFCATTLLALTVYVVTMSPSVQLDDSGIYTTGAMYAGVPDCPGFPVWTIYAHLFTVLLPISNMAWRVSVSSAVAAAIACGLIALMVSRMGGFIFENLGRFQRLALKSEKQLRIICGYAAGMSFGLSGSVWSHAVIDNWWPLTFALFAAAICLLFRWSQTPEKTRHLYAAIFIYGLALTNSQSLFVGILGLELLILIINVEIGRDLIAASSLLLIHIVFAARDLTALTLWHVYVALAAFALVLTFVFAIKTRRIFTRWKTVLGSGFFLAFGLLPYLYVPIASMMNPPLNWGYPRTVEGFFHTISRGQYQQILTVDTWGRYGDQIRFYGKLICTDYGWLYLFPAAIPFFFLHRLRVTERKFMFGLLPFFLCESFFLVSLLNPSSDRASEKLNEIFFAPSYLLLALWTGCGLLLLGAMHGRSRERKDSEPKKEALRINPVP